MSILLFVAALLAAVLAIRWFLFWTLPELPEDVAVAEAPDHPSLFYDPRTWAVFHPKPLLSYRRDKKGRFRKMP
jgi:hypothetical protein